MPSLSNVPILKDEDLAMSENAVQILQKTAGSTNEANDISNNATYGTLAVTNDSNVNNKESQNGSASSISSPSSSSPSSSSDHSSNNSQKNSDKIALLNKHNTNSRTLSTQNNFAGNSVIRDNETTHHYLNEFDRPLGSVLEEKLSLGEKFRFILTKGTDRDQCKKFGMRIFWNFMEFFRSPQPIFCFLFGVIGTWFNCTIQVF